MLDLVYARCRDEIVCGGGEAAWEKLVHGYFRAHPMWHVELNANGHRFAEYLAATDDGALPPWLHELADFEWWEWQVRIAPDAPQDEDEDDSDDVGSDGVGQQPLRIAATVELRPYSYDLLAFMERAESAGEGVAPAPGHSLLLFWRDRDLDPRVDRVDPIELVVLKAVSEDTPLDAAAGAARVALDALLATADDLWAAGVLRGRITRGDG